MNAIRIATLALALLLAGLTCLPAATQGPGDGFSVTYKSPAAPQLRLKSLDGGEYDLSTVKGRVVVVSFWATWCPPCIEELPTMQKLWEETRDQGLDVLAVNVGEPADRIRQFLHEFEPELTFPILRDPDGEAFQAWGVLGLPKTYVVNKRGQVIYEAEGGRNMNSEHIRERLRALINE
ncbi:MAG: redoxin domain-containing protein [Proteobacteria bacterium]|nr:redoxin domain-containing protein [Pseudomonadota bacterium]